MEAQGENGFVVATESFGIKSAPACEFVVTQDVNMSDITFGHVHTITELGNFVLANLEVST